MILIELRALLEEYYFGRPFIHHFNFICWMSEPYKSKLQKKFMTTTVYKRSKQYFDINRLNKIQKEQELSRRKPTNPQTDLFNIKFEQSFYSTSIKLNERVQTELSKCLTRGWKEEDIDETQTSCTFNGRKGKTLDMNKMLSREYFDKETEFNKNQSRFCNFRPYRAPNNHTVDFEKFFVPSRTLRDKAKSRQCMKCATRDVQTIQTSNIAPPEIGITKQKLRFDESIFRTLVDFKKNDKQKSEREKQAEEPQRHLDRIVVGENLTRKNMKLGLVEFYHGETKWSAPQMDNRLMKQNEYFLKEQNRLDEKRIDWTMVKRKTDLVQTRRRDIMGRKQIKDVKGEICDEKFFRRNFF